MSKSMCFTPSPSSRARGGRRPSPPCSGAVNGRAPASPGQGREPADPGAGVQAAEKGTPAPSREWMSSALRREGMTQEAAARQLGVSVKTVSRWVGGATQPRMRGPQADQGSIRRSAAALISTALIQHGTDSRSARPGFFPVSLPFLSGQIAISSVIFCPPRPPFMDYWTLTPHVSYGGVMPVPAGRHRVGADRDRLVLNTGRDGLAASAGHDLIIEASRWSGELTVGGRRHAVSA